MSIKILAAFIFATDILFTNEKHSQKFCQNRYQTLLYQQINKNKTALNQKKLFLLAELLK